MEYVHPIHRQSGQASLQGFAYRNPDAPEVGGWEPHLGADDCVFGLELLKNAAEVPLRFAVPILYGGIEIIHAGLQRPRNGACLVIGVASDHQSAHRTAPKTQERNLHSTATEGSLFHHHSFPNKTSAPKGVGELIELDPGAEHKSAWMTRSPDAVSAQQPARVHQQASATPARSMKSMGQENIMGRALHNAPICPCDAPVREPARRAASSSERT